MCNVGGRKQRHAEAGCHGARNLDFVQSQPELVGTATFYLTYPQIVESLTPQFAKTLLPGTDANIRESLTPEWIDHGIQAPRSRWVRVSQDKAMASSSSRPTLARTAICAPLAPRSPKSFLR